jgi:hypothetical protein
VEIKEFKEGIAFLTKLTNQRRTDPEPFMVQVGADGQISLIAGDERGTFIWRTGQRSSSGRLREGVQSKPLAQIAKTLKGKFTVELSISKNSLEICTSEGGSLSAPFVEGPSLTRPNQGERLGSFKIDDVAGLGAKIGAASNPKEGWRKVQIGDGFLTTTDSKKFFRSYIGQVFHIKETVAHRTTFWDALSGWKTNGEAIVYESGLRIRAGNYEAFTGFVEPDKYPDMVEAEYPEGSALPNMAVMDRRVLIGSLKAVGPNVEISLFKDKMVNLSDAAKRQVGMTAKQGRGSSSIRFSAELMTDILSAMSGKEVIVAWKDARKPLRIVDAGKQSDVFLLAPVSRIA